MSWRIVFTKRAQKDARRLSEASLRPATEKILENLGEDPYDTPPRSEKLVGDLEGAFSRRINIKHRLVYQVFFESKTVKVLRMWTHYE